MYPPCTGYGGGTLNACLVYTVICDEHPILGGVVMGRVGRGLVPKEIGCSKFGKSRLTACRHWHQRTSTSLAFGHENLLIVRAPLLNVPVMALHALSISRPLQVTVCLGQLHSQSVSTISSRNRMRSVSGNGTELKRLSSVFTSESMSVDVTPKQFWFLRAMQVCYDGATSAAA